MVWINSSSVPASRCFALKSAMQERCNMWKEDTVNLNSFIKRYCIVWRLLRFWNSVFRVALEYFYFIPVWISCIIGIGNLFCLLCYCVLTIYITHESAGISYCKSDNWCRGIKCSGVHICNIGNCQEMHLKAHSFVDFQFPYGVIIFHYMSVYTL